MYKRREEFFSSALRKHVKKPIHLLDVDKAKVSRGISTKQPFGAAVAIRQEIAPACDQGGKKRMDGEHDEVHLQET